MTEKILKLISSQISEFQLESLLQTLDRLHDAATNDEFETVCSADPSTVIGWLEDIIFTAQETIGELQRKVDGEQLETLPVISMMKYRQG